MIQRAYEFDPLLCECGSKLERISIVEARTQSDIAGNIPKHINLAFEALPLPVHPPPPSHPEPGGAQDGGSLLDAYCF